MKVVPAPLKLIQLSQNLPEMYIKYIEQDSESKVKLGFPLLVIELSAQIFSDLLASIARGQKQGIQNFELESCSTYLGYNFDKFGEHCMGFEGTVKSFWGVRGVSGRNFYAFII